MWWPSFRSVLYDLWYFVWGLEVTRPSVETAASIQTLTPAIGGLPAAPTLAVPISLSPDVRHDATHATTTAIRAYLTAETTLRTSADDLTAYEWLAYRFTVAKRSLPWLALALAPIGYWHQALKGLPNVTIGLLPKTHALMEWQDELKHGHVAYVTAVSPEETITVHELGAVLPGVLREETKTVAEWKESRPVFISVA